MSELTIGEILAQARGQLIIPVPDAPAPKSLSAPAVAQPADLFTCQSAGPAVPSPPVAASQLSQMPTGHLATLALWQRVSPKDASRWETLLHNAWMTGAWWYGTLCLFCSGGCRLVTHEAAGWALRFDAEIVDKLRAAGNELAFGSEQEYRDWASRALGPRKTEFTELLQLSSLGVLVDEDYDWAFNEAIRRKVG